MVHFVNCQIEIYEPSEKPHLDPYTNEPKDTWDLITVVDADFQNISPEDTQREVGKFLEDTHKIYVDIDTPVTDKSVIKIKGEPHTYEVIGSPQKFPTFHNFTKIIVQRERHDTL